MKSILFTMPSRSEPTTTGLLKQGDFKALSDLGSFEQVRTVGSPKNLAGRMTAERTETPKGAREVGGQSHLSPYFQVQSRSGREDPFRGPT